MKSRTKVLVFFPSLAIGTFVMGTIDALTDWDKHEYTLSQHYGYSGAFIFVLLSLFAAGIWLSSDDPA